MIKSYLTVGLMAATMFATSCDKKNNTPVTPPVTDTTGSVAIHVENVAGDKPLQLNSETYVNANGDSFTVRMYKYYLTNFRLVKEDGTEYVQPESYYLINQADEASFKFNIDNVPSGKYTHIRFMQGVDSVRNVSGAQDGALDPLHGMFWTWSTGYIMAKIEGNSTSVPTSAGNLIFHLGGFTRNGAVKEIEIPLTETIVVGKEKNPAIYLRSDILKWFTGSANIDFSTTYNVMEPGFTSTLLVENYSKMMSVTKVTN